MKKTIKNKKIALSKQYNDRLIKMASNDIQEVYDHFNTRNEGLNELEVENNQERFGTNIINPQKTHHWYNSLQEAFFNPFSVVLIFIAILMIAIPSEETPDKWFNAEISEWAGFGIIISLIIISGIIKLFQEIRSNKAAEKLKALITNTALIERENEKKEIPFGEIVAGDIIHLAAGDMIPADLRIINSKDLYVTQSSLTGESEPVEKHAGFNNVKQALEAQNLCFMGTTVASGTAKGVVLVTGMNTYFGKISKAITKKRPKTSFDKGIARVSWLLIYTMLCMAAVIFILQGTMTSGDNSQRWLKALIFTLAVAVGLTPEMLPMIVTLNLAKEAFRLSKQKTIVKNINAIQSFGAMSVLCTDKTGTLTEDKIVLERHINLDGHEDNRVLAYAYLNSYYQTGIKNLIDLSIIDKAKQLNLEGIINDCAKIDEIPFDFQRRRMSIVLNDLKTNKAQIITKGALEEVLSICSTAEYNNQVVTLTKELKAKFLKTANALNEQGMRVIAIATSNGTVKPHTSFSVADEKDLLLIGYIALLDPPKMSAKKAIKALTKKGVEVKILTGDNEKVAKYTCDMVGIKTKKVLLGSEIEDLTDDQLRKVVMDVSVFAKLSPEQKARVVLAIKANKHVVGFMGDGINDTSAMRAADIAISVDTAVDIAKECADIVLLEKSLMILEHGVIEGRKTFANIIKYIKMTVSGNFGNMLSMVAASIWLTQYGLTPMLPVQILILNMINDFTQFSVPWDNVDPEYVAKPQHWNAKSILKFMLCIGPISSIFDITAFAIMFYVLKWNDPNVNDGLLQMKFSTGWFLVSLLTQMQVIFVLRTEKIPFLQSNPSTTVLLSMSLLLTLGVILVLIHGLESSFKFSSLIDHPEFLGYAVGITSGYVLTSQIAKTAYKKVFKEWL